MTYFLIVLSVWLITGFLIGLWLVTYTDAVEEFRDSLENSDFNQDKIPKNLKVSIVLCCTVLGFVLLLIIIKALIDR